MKSSEIHYLTTKLINDIVWSRDEACIET